MIERLLETCIGIVVIISAVFFLSFLLQSDTSISDKGFYAVQANYNSVGSLASGASVKIAGVTVGKVDNVSLDRESYEAKVTMLIDSGVDIPDDSIAQITIGGLFGDPEIKLKLGTSSTILEPNQSISNTIDAINIEDIIGQLIYKSPQE